MTESGKCGSGTYRIGCPKCSKTWKFQTLTEEIARKVDASMHWNEEHDGPIPDSAPFGDHQCPECLDIAGLDGTASCGECGHVPEEMVDA